jgi:ABC-type amino acid transport substrate-binding protein
VRKSIYRADPYPPHRPRRGYSVASAEATGLQFRIPYPWKRAGTGVRRRRIAVRRFTDTGRERKLLFSDPVCSEQVSIITLCDKTFPFRQMRDLKGKTLGVVNGTSYTGADDRLGSLFRVENDTSRLPGRLIKRHRDAWTGW